MCAITGIWQRNGTPVSQTGVERMLGVVGHRGPDGRAVMVNGDFGMGHARLRIVDLSDAADQPMGLPDGSLWLSYNGEVHNFVELRAELEALGVRFRTSGDTEVVLHALHRWGHDAFERFNGMWALALWEPGRRRLTLARDRFGIKPLFCSVAGERIAFASEAKSILAAFPEERRASASALRNYLRGGWTDVGGQTFFEGVVALPPGRILVVDDQGMQETPFWGFRPGKEYAAGSDHAEEFLALLDDAVRIRTRSDVPVGVCLSGGLDSSAIARLAVRHIDRPVPCFSLRYPGSPVDESGYSQAVANGCERLEINWVEPDGNDLIDTLDRVVWHQDAPTVLRGRYPQWHVMQAASSKVTVVLGGHGADEMLGGYSRFILPWLLDALAAGGPRALPGLWRELVHLTDSAPSGLLTLIRAALKQRYGLTVRPRRDWIAPGLRDAGRGGVDDACRLNAWLSRTLQQPYRSRVNNALWHELSTAGLPEALRSEDALGMAFSLESRLPFLDHRLVELSFRLAFDEKIGGGWSKRILRRATREVLPDAVRLRRRKLGFPGEYRKWFCAPANLERVRAILLDRRCLERGVLDPVRLRRDFGAGQARAAASIGANVEMAWRLVAQELWFRAFIDPAGPVDEPGPYCSDTGLTLAT